MHGPVMQTKPSAVLGRRDVLEAICHSQAFAVKFCRKEGRKSLGFLYSQWEEKVRFLPGTTKLGFGEQNLKESSGGMAE